MSEVQEAESIESIMEKYKGEWVAVKVTERDNVGQPSKGIVIFHDISRFRLRDRLIDEVDVCIFYAGSVPKEGYVAAF